MKLNNKIISILMITGIFAFSGCDEDYLDVTNPNELTPDQFWKTEADVDQAITSLWLSGADRALHYPGGNKQRLDGP